MFASKPIFLVIMSGVSETNNNADSGNIFQNNLTQKRLKECAGLAPASEVHTVDELSLIALCAQNSDDLPKLVGVNLRAFQVLRSIQVDLVVIVSGVSNERNVLQLLHVDQSDNVEVAR